MHAEITQPCLLTLIPDAISTGEGNEDSGIPSVTVLPWPHESSRPKIDIDTDICKLNKISITT